MKATSGTQPFQFVAIEAAAPKVGDDLFAIGNSCNAFSRARFGKVTDLARDVSRAFPGGLVVSDMPLAPGDSGGPVFNAAGNVIGFSDAIGYDEKNPDAERPASFIAPLWDQSKLVTDLKAGYQHEVPFIGINLEELPEELVKQYGGAAGIIVTGVSPGSGAAQAGLRFSQNLLRARSADAVKAAIAESDIITAADGTKVTTSEDLIGYLRSRKVGDTVEFTVQRGKESVKVKVTLGSRRAMQQSR
jgi:serine protease Do